jgi:crossover junction endodeoxyribonuclease RuvC
VTRLLGLDPGLRNTGWGVLDSEANRLCWVADGTVASDEHLPLSDRLAQLHRGVLAVIDRYRPDEAAIEETFVNRNPSSTLKLGQARGAVLAAVGLVGLKVAEYAPLLVKKSVVGSGQAAKQQVGMMVRRLLAGCQATTVDSADALAVAICHAHHRRHASLLARAAEAGR